VQGTWSAAAARGALGQQPSDPLDGIVCRALRCLSPTGGECCPQVEEVRIETARVQERQKAEEDLRREMHFADISQLNLK
jgi:hypothetical protein